RIMDLFGRFVYPRELIQLFRDQAKLGRNAVWILGKRRKGSARKLLQANDVAQHPTLILELGILSRQRVYALNLVALKLPQIGEPQFLLRCSVQLFELSRNLLPARKRIADTRQQRLRLGESVEHL